MLREHYPTRYARLTINSHRHKVVIALSCTNTLSK